MMFVVELCLCRLHFPFYSYSKKSMEREFFVPARKFFVTARTFPNPNRGWAVNPKKKRSNKKSLWNRVVNYKHPGRNQKNVFRGWKGAAAPQFWSTINFNRPEKGAVFLALPNIWSREDLSPTRDICGVLLRFVAFCVVFRCFAAFSGKLVTIASVPQRRFPAFSCVFWRLRHFLARWR